MKIATFEGFEALKKDAEATQDALKKKVLVCCGTGCLAAGAGAVAEALRTELDAKKLNVEVGLKMKETGCRGLCELGPLVTFEPSGIFYKGVKPSDISEIIEKTIEGDETIPRLLYRDNATKKRVETYHDIPFYKRQTRWALRNVGLVDPKDISEYIGRDGFAAMAKALTKMTPEEVIAEVETAKLRGRGGGGFDAGRKWRSCINAKGDERYLVCNGDEGDPGAFMDRTIMEGDPYGVLEGMVIAAYAIQAKAGFIYVRQEYPLAVRHLEAALVSMRELGFLGDEILGTDFSFDIKIARGGGAFVCGESSALMRSIEGKVGEPRAKYIHGTAKGLYDKPTVLNNVETFINVPLIIEKGGTRFASTGTERSKGTKAFSLVGKVQSTGLVEVPMGTTLREIIFEIGGGAPKGRTFKAVQTGGPSGGCLPESHLDEPVDFDTLTKAGSMMGSGGMIVMDDRTCMVDVARYFTKFLVDESCGKCVPCREGLQQMLRLLTDICQGRGTARHLEQIDALTHVLEKGSLCALGKSAANPVTSTLRYFREEYLEHIDGKQCKAGVCRDLCRFEITSEACTGCTLCKTVCPVDCITGEKKSPHEIDQEACITCGSCFDVCNFDAIKIL
jgi:NADH:ubiquinone oxidoreductase subunit F (NADH-binding)/(2Fe-2S) ferredoxin/NAD-dependent dihydropyrimidine dehydrogenase PreA subunit